ncbi:MAG: EpsG family protein [Clostridia bacterium]|nr:EpsG family protein [Clostridia bacterium]
MSAASTLWPIFIFTLIIAALSQHFSVYETNELGNRVYVKKEKFFFGILLVSMCLFVGLREWCNDTGTYREGYIYFINATGNIFNNIKWSLGDSPGFQLVNTILKHLGLSSQSFLMFYSIVTNSIYLWFLRKYSNDFWLTIFLFWAMGVYIFTAAAMRQCVAIAFCLIGIDKFLSEKKLPFVLWVLFASIFHAYAFVFLVVPFLMFKPWTQKTWFLFGGAYIVGILLENLLGAVLSVTDMLGQDYSQSEFMGEGVNIFRLLVVWAPIILSAFVQKFIINSEDKVNHLFFNLSSLNAAIMFIALFGTANYFARLANYFLIFQTLSLPWMLSFFDFKNRKTLKLIVIICYMAYLIFAHVILTPFNSYFAKMSLFEYIKIIFD